MERSDISTFSVRLVAWQKHHGRHDLPWQATRDAYRIWLSEIMLQQTQVSTVVSYYLRFLDRFPTVETLAASPLEAVLEHWAGLGYYARARNLHRAARIVVEKHAGEFPRTQDALVELPGVGRSTAAAIAVFAFGASAAILDGNVKRVLCRCFGIEGFPGEAAIERRLWGLAESLLPAGDLAPYTQGLMDLGATVCVRGKPDCAACPLCKQCVAFVAGRQMELPAARPRKQLPERTVTQLLLSDGHEILLERRPAAGIWGGLLSFPEIGEENARAFAERHGCEIAENSELPPVWHAFTHFRLEMRVLHCRILRRYPVADSPDWVWLPVSDVSRAALPAPVRRVLVSVFG